MTTPKGSIRLPTPDGPSLADYRLDCSVIREIQEMSQNGLSNINGARNFDSQFEIGIHARTLPESVRVIPQKELNKIRKFASKRGT
jgi:hypothetical protein